MKNLINYLKTMLVFGAFATSPLLAETRLWTDATGKHKVEAELESFDKGNVILKTPSGKLITLSHDQLSEADRAFVQSVADSKQNVQAESSGTPAPAPTNTPSDTVFNAKGIIMMGSQTSLKVELTAVGGIAADAFSFGPVKDVSCVVDGKTLKLDDRFAGVTGFMPVDRSRGGFLGYPENGLKTDMRFGEIPSKPKVVGPLKGSLTVMAGGTEKEVVITDLLNRRTGNLADPILKAAGLTVKFTRTQNSNQVEVGIQMEGDDANAFSGLELVAADGGKVEAGESNGWKGTTFESDKIAPETDLKGATLKFRFREGAKAVEIPFDIAEVPVRP